MIYPTDSTYAGPLRENCNNWTNFSGNSIDEGICGAKGKLFKTFSIHAIIALMLFIVYKFAKSKITFNYRVTEI